MPVLQLWVQAAFVTAHWGMLFLLFAFYVKLKSSGFFWSAKTSTKIGLL